MKNILRNRDGIAVISLTIIMSLVVISAVVYTVRMNSQVGNEISKDLSKVYDRNDLKGHTKMIALAVRRQLAQGLDPANIKETPNIDISTTTSLELETSKMVNSDFKCKGDTDTVDVKNPNDRVKDIKSPANEVIYYTCQEKEIDNKKGYLISGYSILPKTAEKGEKGEISPIEMFKNAKKTTLFVYKKVEIGTIESVTGTASRSNDLFGTSKPIDVAIDRKIYISDLISTASNGIVKIVMRDNTKIVIGINSAFSFEKFDFQKIDQRETVYQVIKGTVQAWFDKVVIPGDKVYINTKSVAMGIRGTEVVVDCEEQGDDAETSLYVMEGNVALFKPFEKDVKNGSYLVDEKQISYENTRFDNVDVDGGKVGKVFHIFYDIKNKGAKSKASLSEASPEFENEFESLNSSTNTNLHKFMGANVIAKVKENKIGTLMWAYYNEVDTDLLKGPYKKIKDGNGFQKYILDRYVNNNLPVNSKTIILPTNIQYAGFFRVQPSGGIETPLVLEVPEDELKIRFNKKVYSSIIYNEADPTDSYQFIGIDDGAQIDSKDIKIDYEKKKNRDYRITKRGEDTIKKIVDLLKIKRYKPSEVLPEDSSTWSKEKIAKYLGVELSASGAMEEVTATAGPSPTATSATRKYTDDGSPLYNIKLIGGSTFCCKIKEFPYFLFYNCSCPAFKMDTSKMHCGDSDGGCTKRPRLDRRNSCGARILIDTPAAAKLIYLKGAGGKLEKSLCVKHDKFKMEWKVENAVSIKGYYKVDKSKCNKMAGTKYNLHITTMSGSKEDSPTQCYADNNMTFFSYIEVKGKDGVVKIFGPIKNRVRQHDD